MTGSERRSLKQLVDAAKRERLGRARPGEACRVVAVTGVSYGSDVERLEARRRAWRESKRRAQQRQRKGAC